MRHAHAVSDAPTATGDHGRILSPDGLREAHTLAQQLAPLPRPDLVIASTAERTRHTADIVFSGIDIHTEHRLYLADAAQIAEDIRNFKDHHTHVVLVGHNPGMGELAMRLSNLKINTFPTATCAIFACHSESWKTFDTDIQLQEFLTP